MVTMNNEQIDILYLCDNTACLDSCCEAECSHTSKIEHATHKDDLDGRIFEYVTTSRGPTFYELDADLYKLEEVSGKTVKELIELFTTGWTLNPPRELTPSFREFLDSL